MGSIQFDVSLSQIHCSSRNMYWCNLILPYFTMAMTCKAIFPSTDTVSENVRLTDHSDLKMNIHSNDDDCIINKTVGKGRTLHEGFMALTNSEKKIALLTTTSTDLSEDTSVYDIPLTACRKTRL